MMKFSTVNPLAPDGAWNRLFDQQNSSRNKYHVHDSAHPIASRILRFVVLGNSDLFGRVRVEPLSFRHPGICVMRHPRGRTRLRPQPCLLLSPQRDRSPRYQSFWVGLLVGIINATRWLFARTR
jgi:hypothetical protein